MLNRSIHHANGNGAQPTSVGAKWPAAFDQHNSRIKGFSPTIMRDRQDMHKAFGEVREIQEKNQSSTRTTFRAFVNRGLIEEIKTAPLIFPVEAVVPTNGSVPGASLVYFGKNHKGRGAPVHVRIEESEMLSKVLQIKPVGPKQAFQRVEDAGYTISVLNGHTESDAKTLLNLYRETFQEYTFEINRAAIDYMLGNSNLVLIARDPVGEIASCIIGEHVPLTVSNGSKVNLWELSDFATFEKDRSFGINAALQIRAVDLIRGMAGNGGHNAIIYAEDRAPWQGVNVSSQKAGLVYCGTLPMHCTIKSVRSVEYGGANGKLESLNVFAALHSGQ